MHNGLDTQVSLGRRSVRGILLDRTMPAPATTSAPAQGQHLLVVTTAVRAREFHPPTVTIPLGAAVLLVVHNQDAELHAFVPRKFLEHVPLHLDGNGAHGSEKAASSEC
ncbi:MAG: hypothetical protein C4293_12965 [Nitrospiraceae bacterium]